ncbi:Rho GTPase activation protein [Coniochaeta ligniaria NRRL 30616]|uniref:Rho GTPase activation protein n=1 Tax=Coniochaeta ligniaria NRRL 30616 TaxID=1408157 RepID=A0A1J7IPA0_9PEZI|nr:Rho GTPase activation protein [Coniochaeta ligniaria NRRL 30616]
MDRSITTGCFALGNAIGKTSPALNAFVRNVRESRAELDALSGELHSLNGVLDLLRDDASSFPPTLAARTPTVLQHCTAVINELEGYVMVLNSSELSTQAKKLRWAATKSHMAKLRLTLDGYKSTLGLALDLVAFTSAAGKDAGRDSPTDASRNISKTVEEMGRLSARLQGDFQKNAALRSYLDALQLYADSTGINLEPDHASSSMKSVSDAPDSAIEMSDDPPFKSSPTTPDLALRIEEIDELLDELKEMPSNRPPTPPPRNMRRSLSVSSVSSVAPPPIATKRPPLSSVPSNYTFVTTINARDDVAEPPPPIKRGFIGRMFSSTKKRSLSTSSAASIATVDSRPSTSASTTPSMFASERPGGLVRRGSRRMSSTIKSLPMFKPAAEDPVEIDSEPNAVFGVSLQKSIQVAHGSARTRHTTGNGKGGTSHRDFPLCVHKCVNFITSGTEEGVAVPDIFGEAGDAPRLAALRRLFSEGPTYGEDIDWEWFTVYEAADLILVYLSELPKPLVSESVAKRWISLSRQATVSNGSRTDQCLDFWEEALLGVRGPSRNLLKLLLNLWADVAEAADHNGMTAERLAGRIVQPLMHSSARTYTTDYMLGLAFLIRKRSEYLALMQGNKGKAKAAF